MAKARFGLGVFAGCLLVGSLVGEVQAQQPSVAQVLQYRPKMDGVDYSTPAESELARCEVKLIKGTQPGSSGWLLTGGDEKPLRRFFDSNGDKRIDTYSYYKNGLEVYRESDTNFNGKVDSYRWLNSGGMKWGIDTDEDGAIDFWRMISAEEVALEALEAVATKNLARLKALFISDSELQSLGLQPAYVEKIKAKLDKAAEKFTDITVKLPNLAGKKLSPHIEGRSPQCVPGESIGASKDLLRYPTRAVGFQVGENHHEWLNTGEMIQVGLAWRLLDVPTIGDTSAGDTRPHDPKISVRMQKLLEQLAELDKNPPPALNPGPNKAAVEYNMKRAAIIELIIAEAPAAEREPWLKQKGDNLEQAALFSEPGNKTPLEELRQYKEQVVRQSPESKLAAYLTYRLLRAQYLPELTRTDVAGPALAKVQAEWMEKLAGFVQAYPKAEDTPDALYQLAMGAEYSLKDDEAKKYYKQLATDFPSHPLAARCEGAVRRLDLVGQKMELIGQTLTGSTFSIANQRGKAVVVYYWASYCTDCASHFDKLRALHQKFAAKGFEIVSVNLDDDATKARTFLQGHPLPGEHLIAAGKDTGMNSPLATQYGIMGLPTIFLVGKDGNVITRNIQINDLEDAVKKAVEK